MRGSLLTVEIKQGFLEEAPVELSLEGWAGEGKRERRGGKHSGKDTWEKNKPTRLYF
jgi:hypothetical protein